MKQNRDLGEVWKIALAQIEVKLDNPTHFRTWIQGSELLDVKGEKAILGVRNHYTADWIKRKHHQLVVDTISYVYGENVEVDYKIAGDLANEQTPKFKPQLVDQNSESPSLLDVRPDGQTPDLHQALVRYKINPKFTFETLVQGESNRMAVAAAEGVAESPGKLYNPLFLHGDTGLGKTHLAHALARRLLERNPNKKIVYTSAENFMNQMVSSIKSGRTAKFRQRFRDEVELLIVDDIQFITDWEKTQTELFNTFNALHAAEKQILIISDRPPEQLENLTPRLKSRFQGGIVTDVQKPDFEHRLAILHKKASSLGHSDINPDFLNYLAKNVTANIRELEGALQKVVLLDSLAGNRDLTFEEIAKQIGRDTISKRKRLSVPAVIRVVAKEFDLKPSDIKGNRRTKVIALSRQICMYVLREELNYKLEEIAGFLNRKDHTTVIHGIEKVKSMRMADEGFRAQLINIMEELQEN